MAVCRQGRRRNAQHHQQQQQRRRRQLVRHGRLPSAQLTLRVSAMERCNEQAFKRIVEHDDGI